METRSMRRRKNLLTPNGIPIKKMKTEQVRYDVLVCQLVVTRPMTAEQREEEIRQIRLLIQQIEAETEELRREIARIQEETLRIKEKIRSYKIIFQEYWEGLIRIRTTIQDIEGRVPDPEEQKKEIPSLVDKFFEEVKKMQGQVQELEEPNQNLTSDLKGANEEEEDNSQLKEQITEKGLLKFKKFIQEEIDHLQNSYPDFTFTLSSQSDHMGNN